MENDRCFKGENPDHYLCGIIVEIDGKCYKVVRNLFLQKCFEAGHRKDELSRYDPDTDRLHEVTTAILRGYNPMANKKD